MTRTEDMVLRYGEICSLEKAAFILSCGRTTIERMVRAGRLRRCRNHYIDIRSIAAYIENGNAENADAMQAAWSDQNLKKQDQVKQRIVAMVELHGATCTYNKAAAILSMPVIPVFQLVLAGKLRNEGDMIDVASLGEYIEEN